MESEARTEVRDLLPWARRTLPEHLLLCMHDPEDASKVLARTPQKGLWVSVAEVELDGEVALCGRPGEGYIEFDLDIGMRIDVLRAETDEAWHILAHILHFEADRERPEVAVELGPVALEPELEDDLRRWLQRGEGAELLWRALERWREEAQERWLQATAQSPPPASATVGRAAAAATARGGTAAVHGGSREKAAPWASYPFLPSALAGVGGPAVGWLQPPELPAWLPSQPGMEALLQPPRLKPSPKKCASAPKAGPGGKACAGGCGFVATWHPTHCCNFCLVKRGHGGRCERVLLQQAEPAEEQTEEAPARPAAATLWPFRGKLAGEGAERGLEERAEELRGAIAERDFGRAFARLDAEAANFPASGSGHRALHACVEAGSADLLQMVLAARAEVNAQDASGRSALQLAAARGYAELCRLLMEAGAVAADAGAGLAAEGPAEGRLSQGQEQVCSLLEEAERPQKYGRALLKAITQKDARTAESAIDAGGDVNCADERGESPLLLLAKGQWRGQEAQQAELARRLGGAGASLACSGGLGSGPLHHAAHRGSLELVEALLELRADVGAANDEGSTPLMYAAHGGHGEVCSALLEAFAPCGARNKHGLTAERIAARQGFRRCAVLIQAYEMAPKRPGEEEPKRKAKSTEPLDDGSNWSALEKVLREEEEKTEGGNDKFKQAMALMRGETPGWLDGGKPWKERAREAAEAQKRSGPFDYSHWDRVAEELLQKEELLERQESLERQPEFVWQGGAKLRVMV